MGKKRQNLNLNEEFKLKIKSFIKEFDQEILKAVVHWSYNRAYVITRKNGNSSGYLYEIDFFFKKIAILTSLNETDEIVFGTQLSKG